MSRWLGDAGMSICLAVAVSMVVSLTIIPLASSRLFRAEYRRFDPWLKRAVVLVLLAAAGWKLYSEGLSRSQAWIGRWLERIAASFAGMEWTTAVGLAVGLLLLAGLVHRFRRHGMRQTYVSTLNWTLNHRFLTLAFTLALLGSGIYLYLQIPQQGTPWTPERRVDISVEVDRSYSLEEVREMFEDMERVMRGLTQMTFTVRGYHGEGTNAVGNLFQISNQSTMGVPEGEIVEKLVEVTRQIMAHEKEAQAALLKEAPSQVEDKVWRAYGLLAHARVLSSQEFMNLLSAVRLGRSLGIIDGMSSGFINQLMIITQPSHLQAEAGVDLSPEERDIRRAEVARRHLAELGAA